MIKKFDKDVVREILVSVRHGESMYSVTNRLQIPSIRVCNIVNGKSHRDVCPELERRINGVWQLLPSSPQNGPMITDQVVRDLLTAVKKGTTLRQVAKDFGLSGRQVQRICNGLTYLELAPEVPRRVRGQWRVLQPSIPLPEPGPVAPAKDEPEPLELTDSPAVQPQLVYGVFTSCGRLAFVRRSVNLTPEQTQPLRARGFSVRAFYSDEIRDFKRMCDACQLRGRCLFPAGSLLLQSPVGSGYRPQPLHPQWPRPSMTHSAGGAFQESAPSRLR